MIPMVTSEPIGCQTVAREPRGNRCADGIRDRGAYAHACLRGSGLRPFLQIRLSALPGRRAWGGGWGVSAKKRTNGHCEFKL